MSSFPCTPAPGPIHAVLTVPGSKSLTNRALITAALAHGTSVLRGVSAAEDVQVMINVLRGLGVTVTVETTDDNASRTVTVVGCRGQIPVSTADLDCGNSGTTMRFAAAVAALGHGTYRLDGHPRMRFRPLHGLVDGLRQLGAGIEYLSEEGFPPITVHAHGLRGGLVSLPSPSSSQFITALLLAAPGAGGDVMIETAGCVPSPSYLVLTTQIMRRFGVELIEQLDDPYRFIVPAPQPYRAATLDLEPDASSAAYLLAIPALVGGAVTVQGLGSTSRQPDLLITKLLSRMGCRVRLEPDQTSVERPTPGDPLRALDVDLNVAPDLAPTIAVLALFADGPTTIRNVASLRVKECDRLAALAAELARLGAAVDQGPDGLTIHPPRPPRGAVIETYDDHRMAMSFALAGLRVPGVVIRDPDCCAKTFPGFFDLLARLVTPNR